MSTKFKYLLYGGQIFSSVGLLAANKANFSAPFWYRNEKFLPTLGLWSWNLPLKAIPGLHQS